MPQRRTVYRKRRKQQYRKKYGYFGKFGNDATKALKMAGKALSMLNTEDKFRDNFQTSFSSTTTPSLTLLNELGQGTAESNRIGASVKNKSIYIRFFCDNNQSNPAPQYVRYMIVKDKQPNGAVPAITDILNGSTIQSARQINKAKRFQVYRDEVFYVDNNTKAGHVETIFVDLKDGQDDHTEYSGNSGTITDISTNAYYFIHFSNIAGVSNPPIISWTSRMRFIDN